jgi:hypothetical protein
VFHVAVLRTALIVDLPRHMQGSSSNTTHGNKIALRSLLVPGVYGSASISFTSFMLSSHCSRTSHLSAAAPAIMPATAAASNPAAPHMINTDTHPAAAQLLLPGVSRICVIPLHYYYMVNSHRSRTSHLSAAAPAIMPATAAASHGMLLSRPVTARPWLPREAMYSGIQFCRAAQHNTIQKYIQYMQYRTTYGMPHDCGIGCPGRS